MTSHQSKIIKANEEYQTGYSYILSEPVGKNFAPDFRPDLTPQEMLELGVFGGNYFPTVPNEFPKNWFTHAKLASGDTSQKELNYFGINASQPREVWQTKGWMHKDDPLGWFLWYCRYYQGRRHPDDERQIKRWKAYRRHLSQVGLNCYPGDMHCRPKQRQSLLHWAYDARKI
jgi:hypothetical protein